MRTPALACLAAATLLSATAGLSAVTASAAPSPSRPHTPSQRYIVTTKSATSTRTAASDVDAGGGRIHHTYSRAFSGFSASLSAQQVRHLRRDGRIRSVVADAVMHSSDRRESGGSSSRSVGVSARATQSSAPWGLDRIDQRSSALDGSYRYRTTGNGVTAFVIDTGIRAGHVQFGGRVRSGHDFVDGDANASDCYGHGTHVAGTIGGSTYGVAKGVREVSLRVLDCDGYGYASDIIDALEWVVAHKPAGPSVINLSLGGEPYPLLDAAVNRAVRAGIVVVVAAGNDGDDACSSSPARVSRAITVAATDVRDTRPRWSNVGRCVDLFAPGVQVRSASNTSNTASEVMSGTSMATPHVVGVVARYLQVHPKATPDAVAKALLGNSTRNRVSQPASTPNRLLYAPMS